MVWKLDGVAFVGLFSDSPQRVSKSRSGVPCATTHTCATGKVRPISYTHSRWEGAALICEVQPTESESMLRTRLADELLTYQEVRGELEIVRVQMSALKADEAGHGERPWKEMAALDRRIAIELGPRMEGIREIRLRDAALAELEISDPQALRPAEHLEEIMAAARRVG